MKLTNHIQETRAELKHVNWPSRNQAIAFTVIVVAVAVVTAALLGLFDFGFTKALSALISKF